MAQKKANLANALDALPQSTPAAKVPEKEAAPAARRAPSREGMALVGAHLHPRYKKSLKLLAAETGIPQQNLLEEALDMLFVKKGVRVSG